MSSIRILILMRVHYRVKTEKVQQVFFQNLSWLLRQNNLLAYSAILLLLFKPVLKSFHSLHHELFAFFQQKKSLMRPPLDALLYSFSFSCYDTAHIRKYSELISHFILHRTDFTKFDVSKMKFCASRINKILY